MSATGIDAATVAAVVSPDWSSVASPEGNYVTQIQGALSCATSTDFVVRTEFIDPATGSAVPTDGPAFMIVIP